MDADHIVIAKRFEEKMNGLLKKTKERKIAKKITNISRGSISKKKCCEGFLPKGRCATKKKPWRPWSFDYQKTFTNSFCEKYLIETFGFIFMSNFFSLMGNNCHKKYY